MVTRQVKIGRRGFMELVLRPLRLSGLIVAVSIMAMGCIGPSRPSSPKRQQGLPRVPAASSVPPISAGRVGPSSSSMPQGVTGSQNGPSTTRAVAPPPSATRAVAPPSLSQATGARSWPTEADTGAVGTLAPVEGDVVLDSPNTTYANKRVHGTVAVTACGITVRNVEIDAGGPPTDDVFALWLKQPANCAVTVDHVTIQATARPNDYLTTGIRVGYGGWTTVTSSKIIGPQLGILGMGSGLVQDSYILLGATQRGDHDDGFQSDGASGITIRHNTILNPNAQTSAVALYTENGPNSNILVTDNLLAGGGYTCYCGDGKTDNAGNPARASNVRIVDNVFWRKFFPDAGYYGFARAYNPAGGGRWDRNVYMGADGTISTRQVPPAGVDS
jgi:hypothetical protein